MEESSLKEGQRLRGIADRESRGAVGKVRKIVELGDGEREDGERKGSRAADVGQKRVRTEGSEVVL